VADGLGDSSHVRSFGLGSRKKSTFCLLNLGLFRHDSVEILGAILDIQCHLQQTEANVFLYCFQPQENIIQTIDPF
jgi:hypothetical protein